MSEINLNDFKRQWRLIEADVLKAVQRCGESGWYILGKEVSRFEQELASLVRVRHVAGCASGLDGLALALMALNIKPGTSILTTPLSAFATTQAILKHGCRPIFVDVDTYGLMDLDLSEQILASDRSISCIIPVHLYGHAINLDKLQALKEKFDLKIIEDCAQSVGATYNGKTVGAVGDAAATSFYPTKNLGCIGDGGAVFSTDQQLIQTVKVLRDYGQAGKYNHVMIGMNSRLDELQAAILNSALIPRFQEWTQQRRAIANRYIQEIRHEGIEVPGAPNGSASVWHLFPILVKGGLRDQLGQYLHKSGVQTASHYPKLIPDQVAIQTVDFSTFGPLKNAELYAMNELTLPCHPFMTAEEVTRVVDLLNAWNC